MASTFRATSRPAGSIAGSRRPPSTSSRRWRRKPPT